MTSFFDQVYRYLNCTVFHLLTNLAIKLRNLFFFESKIEHKDEHKTIFKHRFIHKLAKLATAEGIKLSSLN